MNAQDIFNEELVQESQIASIQNKCPGCGANMSFDISSGNLKCNHCATTKDLNDQERVTRRKITDEVLNSHKKWTEGRVHQCENCGSKEVAAKGALSVKCAFCGSNKVAEISELPGIRPDSVVPFRLTKQNAENQFKSWLKGKFLAPKSIKRENIYKEINSVYTPVWSLSAATVNRYHGTIGRTVTRTVGAGQNRRTVVTVRWFRVNGVINREYLDNLYQSGGRVAGRTFNLLKPYNLNDLKVYRPEYLSGLVAEHYSKTLDQCIGEFAGSIRRDISNLIIRRYMADQVGHLAIDTQYNNKRFNYMLLPVYVSLYEYKGKRYNFYINGQTGRVSGQYPKSFAKITSISLLTLAILGGIGFAIMRFL